MTNTITSEERLYPFSLWLKEAKSRKWMSRNPLYRYMADTEHAHAVYEMEVAAYELYRAQQGVSEQ